MIKRDCNQSANISSHPNWNPSFSSFLGSTSKWHEENISGINVVKLKMKETVCMEAWLALTKYRGVMSHIKIMFDKEYVSSRMRGLHDEYNGFWIGFIVTSITVTINYNSSRSVTLQDPLHSLLNYECRPFHCDEWRTKNLWRISWLSFLLRLIWTTSAWRMLSFSSRVLYYYRRSLGQSVLE
jgi:hypothetical protein